MTARARSVRRSATVSPLGVVVLLALGVGALSAQTSPSDPTDAQAWYATKLTLDLPDKWEASLQYRARYADDASGWKGGYVTTEVGKGLSKTWSLTASHRLAVVDGGTFHRLAAGATWERKAGATRLSLRGLVQHQFENFDANDEGSGTAQTFLRTRLQVRRTLSPTVAVYASAEPYFTFAGSYPIDNWRNTVGTRIGLGDGRTLDLFYIYRPDYAKAYNRTFHVVGVDLDFDLKVRRRGR